MIVSQKPKLEETTVFYSVPLPIDGESGDLRLEGEVAKIMEEYLALWKMKQASYGPRNIGDFGERGCLIRASDKIQRLRRALFMNKDVGLPDEKLEDTWLDMIGYAIMGLMCHRGVWPNG